MYALSTMTNIYIRKVEFYDICLIFQTEKWLFSHQAIEIKNDLI